MADMKPGRASSRSLHDHKKYNSQTISFPARPTFKKSWTAASKLCSSWTGQTPARGGCPAYTMRTCNRPRSACANCTRLSQHIGGSLKSCGEELRRASRCTCRSRNTEKGQLRYLKVCLNEVLLLLCFMLEHSFLQS